MRVVPVAAAFALLPALALAQSQAIEAARGARSAAEQASQERAGRAEAQGEEAPDSSVDLGAAAERLENPGPVEGTQRPLPSGGAVAPPDTYTVKPGDTLWDLSGRFLNNPWYWPKVWSYNPEISNPHWIYPGNLLRFFPAAEGQPARIQPVPAPQAAPEPVAEAEPEAPRELEDLTRADMGKAQDYGDEDAVAVAGPYKIGFVAPRGLMARRETFVTRRELEEAGDITGAFEDKRLLSVQDRAYARFRGATPRVGQSFVIFRTVRPVTHPRTGEVLGYQTQLMGSAKVVAVDPKAVSLQILGATDPIERGDYLGPQTERTVKMVARRPNQRQLDGSIVGTEREAIWLAAEHHVVFVDRGRADGVEEGNVFTVLRSGDPFGREMDGERRAAPDDPRLPAEDIGELLVIDAKENYSTTLVVRSLRELAAGDRVEMRAGRAAAAGSGGF